MAKEYKVYKVENRGKESVEMVTKRKMALNVEELRTKLVPILEKHTVLAQATQGQVKLDPLIPGYGPVHVPEHDKRGGVDLVGEKDRRIFDVAPGRFP